MACSHRQSTDPTRAEESFAAYASPEASSAQARSLSKRCVCWEARAHLLQHELEPLPDLLRGAPLRRRTLDSLAPSPCSWKAGEVASDATWISKNK